MSKGKHLGLKAQCWIIISARTIL